MQTGFSKALLDSHNPRGHPILAALAYAFCPAAARWWLAGADPVPVFDPVWEALADRAGGQTLREALETRGLRDLSAEIKAFIQRVDACRRHNPGVPVPECAATFTGWALDKDRLRAKGAGLQSLGGKWENLLAYAHAWTFLVPDWRRAMRFSTMPELQPATLAITAPGVRKPVRWPIWQWSLKAGVDVRVVLGILVAGDPNSPNQLVFSLAQHGQQPGEKPWAVAPELWALSRADGSGRSFRSRLPDQPGIGYIVADLAALAETGPHPPLRALESPAGCRFCGFQAQCWVKVARVPNNPPQLSSLAFSQWMGNR